MSIGLPKKAEQMSMNEMMQVIREAKLGDKLQLVFTDKTFDGDLKGRMYFILAMHDNGTIQFDWVGAVTLGIVADKGNWKECGTRTFIITVSYGFDPEYFIARTIGRELLESIRKI